MAYQAAIIQYLIQYRSDKPDIVDMQVMLGFNITFSLRKYLPGIEE